MAISPVDTAGEARARDRRVRWTLLVLLVVVAAYFLPRGEYPNPDSHLALTYALVEQHTVRINSYLTMSDSLTPLLDKAVYCGPRTNAQTCTTYYTDKAPVVSFWTALLYAPLRVILPSRLMPMRPGSDRFILRWLLTLLAVTVPCGLFLGLLRQFLADLAGRQAALVVTIGYGFGSIALIFSTLLFSHALTAALLGTAFILLYAATRLHRAGGMLDLRALTAGLLAGLAVGCEYPAAMVTLILGFYALSGIRAGWLRRGLTYAAGVAIGLVPLLVYNLLVFGSPFSLGYLHLPDPYYAHGMQEGLFGVGLPQPAAMWGITFGAERGLFYFCPWLLLAFPSFRGMVRAGHLREALVCGTVVLSYFLLVSGYVFWDGGASSVGPRHFLPALPFLTIPVVFLVRAHGVRRLAWILVGVSCLIMADVLVTGPLLGLGDPLWDETVPALIHGRIQNNWGMLLGLRGLPSLLPLAIVLVWLARGLLPPRRRRFLHFFYRPATVR